MNRPPLGWMQRATLTALSESPEGLLAAEVADVLGLRPRRARTLIERLRVRGLVHTVTIGSRVDVGVHGPLRAHVYPPTPVRPGDLGAVQCEDGIWRAPSGIPRWDVRVSLLAPASAQSRPPGP